MRLKATIHWISSLVLCAVLLAQVPSGRDVVKPEIYASLEPVARGSSFQIAVVMKIRPGFHVNAREKSEDYLIATDLKAALPAGFNSGEVSYPKGKLEKFTFSKIPLKLRYQACSNELCLPPVTITLDAVVNMAASDSAAKPAHAEIFGKP